jgi:hypothetical protein
VEGGLIATPLFEDDDEVDTEELAKQNIRSLRRYAKEDLDDSRDTFLYLLNCLEGIIDGGLKL